MALCLAACSGGGDEAAESYDAAAADMAPAESVNIELVTEAPVDASSGSAPAAPVQPASTIAYAYFYGLELPSNRVAEVRSRHEAACVEAGTSVCQLLGSETQSLGDDQSSATLRLRAAPGWLTGFRAGLAEDADAVGGRITQSRTDAEDLSRSLTDTEARLRALETLRDRLQQLLATRSGPLEQLLQTERELARVQGELDATRSALAVLRDRVSMSQLTITYQSESRFASNSVFSPVADALGNSLRVFMATLGGLIYLVAGLLPLLLILLPIGWLALRWHRKRRAGSTPDIT
jgi:hypothetical protein